MSPALRFELERFLRGRTSWTLVPFALLPALAISLLSRSVNLSATGWFLWLGFGYSYGGVLGASWGTAAGGGDTAFVLSRGGTREAIWAARLIVGLGVLLLSLAAAAWAGQRSGVFSAHAKMSMEFRTIHRLGPPAALTFVSADDAQRFAEERRWNPTFDPPIEMNEVVVELPHAGLVPFVFAFGAAVMGLLGSLLGGARWRWRRVDGAVLLVLLAGAVGALALDHRFGEDLTTGVVFARAYRSLPGLVLLIFAGIVLRGADTFRKFRSADIGIDALTARFLRRRSE